MKNSSFLVTFLLVVSLFSPHFSEARPRVCKPSGKVKGRKPPPGHCLVSDCCIEGRYYNTYKCSPSVSSTTKAVMNLNGFEKGGDGSLPPKCDNEYHSDDTPVVALSTGWYDGGQRCLKNITITGNGRSVDAMVVDECNSSVGCDADDDYLPPCGNGVVGASQAVWKALGVPLRDWGELEITWSDTW